MTGACFPGLLSMGETSKEIERITDEMANSTVKLPHYKVSNVRFNSNLNNNFQTNLILQVVKMESAVNKMELILEKIEDCVMKLEALHFSPTVINEETYQVPISGEIIENDEQN